MNLAELILTHKGTRSYEQLERDCGGRPKAQGLQQMVKGSPKQFLEPESIVGLARGLNVAQVEVVLAIAESLDLEVARSVPRIVAYLPADSDRLDAADLQLVGQITRRLMQTSDEPQGPGSYRVPERQEELRRRQTQTRRARAKKDQSP